MTKATDRLLGELHGRLAKSMLAALTSSEQAETLLAEYEGDLPEPVAEFLRQASAASPALLTSIARFLKDNAITCAVEDSDEMSDLERRLAEKRSRRSVAATAFE